MQILLSVLYCTYCTTSTNSGLLRIPTHSLQLICLITWTKIYMKKNLWENVQTILKKNVLIKTPPMSEQFAMYSVKFISE